MKYKKLTRGQIRTSLDRLTRFKQTKEKYLRVFFDIISESLLEPKYKRSELESLDCLKIRDCAEEIFNGSLDFRVNSFPNEYLINKKLKDYENSVYKNDNDTQILLSNKIDYVSALPYIEDKDCINLKWLKSLWGNDDLRKIRERDALKFPIEKVVLAEGLTEEILLPAFSMYLGCDFHQKGVQVIQAGGKNQVVKMYYKLIEELKIPIFLLLDKDAEENIRQIEPKLRKTDKIHLVSCGEFEDLLTRSLIIKTVNSHFENFLSITEKDFDIGISNVKNLENIFKTRGLHEFKKADFAKLVCGNITQNSDISSEVKQIIREITVMT